MNKIITGVIVLSLLTACSATEEAVSSDKSESVSSTSDIQYYQIIDLKDNIAYSRNDQYVDYEENPNEFVIRNNDTDYVYVNLSEGSYQDNLGLDTFTYYYERDEMGTGTDNACQVQFHSSIQEEYFTYSGECDLYDENQLSIEAKKCKHRAILMLVSHTEDISDIQDIASVSDADMEKFRQIISNSFNQYRYDYSSYSELFFDLEEYLNNDPYCIKQDNLYYAVPSEGYNPNTGLIYTDYAYDLQNGTYINENVLSGYMYSYEKDEGYAGDGCVIQYHNSIDPEKYIYNDACMNLKELEYWAVQEKYVAIYSLAGKYAKEHWIPFVYSDECYEYFRKVIARSLEKIQ